MDKLCKESDYKFRKDFNASDGIKIKSEFSEEGTTINYGESRVELTENTEERSNVTECGLTQVKKEQYDDEMKYESKFQIYKDRIKKEVEIKAAPNSDFDGIKKEAAGLSSGEFVFIKSEEPSFSTNETNSSHKCEFCQKTLATKRSLIRHMKFHPEKQSYNCTVCSKEFIASCLLSQHMKTHIEEQSYECNICEKRYKRKTSLDMHRTLHSGEKRYKCESCDYKSFKKYDLKIHSRCHTGERPYKCDICNTNFLRRDHLLVHLRWHAKERRFKCLFCEKRFSRNNHLVEHARLHTEETFKCDICSKRYRSKNSLGAHYKLLHCEYKF